MRVGIAVIGPVCVGDIVGNEGDADGTGVPKLNAPSTSWMSKSITIPSIHLAAKQLLAICNRLICLISRFYYGARVVRSTGSPVHDPVSSPSFLESIPLSILLKEPMVFQGDIRVKGHKYTFRVKSSRGSPFHSQVECVLSELSTRTWSSLASPRLTAKESKGMGYTRVSKRIWQRRRSAA